MMIIRVNDGEDNDVSIRVKDEEEGSSDQIAVGFQTA